MYQLHKMHGESIPCPTNGHYKDAMQPQERLLLRKSLLLEHADFGVLVSVLWDGKKQFVHLCGEE